MSATRRCSVPKPAISFVILSAVLVASARAQSNNIPTAGFSSSAGIFFDSLLRSLGDASFSLFAEMQPGQWRTELNGHSVLWGVPSGTTMTVKLSPSGDGSGDAEFYPGIAMVL